MLSRAVDIAYRKPCFAGDRVRAHLRLFEAEDAPPRHGPEQSGLPAGVAGAAGFLAAPGEEARPRCYVRVLLRP